MSANKVESLANWYLRFNGYFTVPNFTVHPDVKKGREAEADILAVRFPYSSEEPGDYCFERDPCLVLPDVVDFLIAEVKSGKCDLNDTWIDSERKNVQYALRWIGFASNPQDIEHLSESIYKSGRGEQNACVIRLASFGSSRNEDLQSKYPGMVQIELLDATKFLSIRLTTGCARLHRENWDEYIQEFVRRIEGGQNADNLLAWTLEKERQK